MHENVTKDEFIQHRAQGWSLGRIAAKLKVSKRTLVQWNRELDAPIRSLRALELEALQEKLLASHEVELTRLARMQQALEAQLAERNLKFVPTEKLFVLAALVRRQIHQVCLDANSLALAEKPPSVPLEPESLTPPLPAHEDSIPTT